MERYVIVNLLSGEAAKFHEKLVDDVCKKFNIQKQKLPGHITLKAPFETYNINTIEKLLEDFSSNHEKAAIKVKDFNHFRNNVIYMDIFATKEAVILHEKLFDELQKLPFLEWKPNESRNRVFHSTIVSRRIKNRFDDIWHYVKSFDIEFDCYLDNITIMKWSNGRWETYKSFKLK